MRLMLEGLVARQQGKRGRRAAAVATSRPTAGSDGGNTFAWQPCMGVQVCAWLSAQAEGVGVPPGTVYSSTPLATFASCSACSVTQHVLVMTLLTIQQGQTGERRHGIGTEKREGRGVTACCWFASGLPWAAPGTLSLLLLPDAAPART